MQGLYFENTILKCESKVFWYFMASGHMALNCFIVKINSINLVFVFAFQVYTNVF